MAFNGPRAFGQLPSLASHRSSEAVLQGDASGEVEISRNFLIPLPRDNPDKRRVIIELADRLVSNYQDSEAAYAEALRNERGLGRLSEQPVLAIDVDRALQVAKHRWSRSTDAINLRDRLLLVLGQEKLTSVNKIVCFGLGGPTSWHMANPLTEEQERRGHGNLSLVRHVAALWMAEIISSYTRKRVRVYSQEESYRPHEADALRAHGIEPLSGRRGRHEGFLKIDARTLVFMFGSDTRQCIRVICATNRPAGIIAQIMRSNAAEIGVRRAIAYLDAEYHEHADWLPFYLWAFHTHVRGPQTVREFMRDGQRPLQGSTVWLRKSRFNP